MTLTFAERQEIARKAVESRRARKALPKPTRKVAPVNGNHPANWAELTRGQKAAWTRKHKYDAAEIIEEAVSTGKLTEDDRERLIAYQRIADLEPNTLVRHYDAGWRYAFLMEAGRTRTMLRTVPAYRGTSRNFRVLTVNVQPVEEKEL